MKAFQIESPIKVVQARANPRASAAILGVAFDSVTSDETVQRIEGMIASGMPHFIATANVDFVVQAQHDEELRRILSEADLVLCDGTPLVWASRLVGRALPERVAGADVVPRLIEVAAEKDFRIFLLGASEEAAMAAERNLRARFPQLNLVGHYSPPFKPLLEMNHEEIRNRIAAAKPDILLVAFGCPKQEKWIAMHYRSLGVPVAIGVGATIDFLGGRVKRAPVWMQRSGTEWIYRLAQEPRRLFKRYASDLVVFGSKFLIQLCLTRSKAAASADAASVTLRTNGWLHLAFAERLDAATVEACGGVIEQVLSDRRDCILNLSEVRKADGSGVALLMHLQREMKKQGRMMILTSVSSRLRRVLRFMGVLEFFDVAEDIQAARRVRESRRQESAYPVTGLTPLIWQGAVTVSNAEEVFTATESRAALLESGDVQIDFSRVRFVDSAGAGMLRRLDDSLNRSGKRLVLTGVSETVCNVLRFARVDDLAVRELRPRVFALDRNNASDLVFSRQPGV